jgi:hypothetical protein
MHARVASALEVIRADYRLVCPTKAVQYRCSLQCEQIASSRRKLEVKASNRAIWFT